MVNDVTVCDRGPLTRLLIPVVVFAAALFLFALVPFCFFLLPLLLVAIAAARTTGAAEHEHRAPAQASRFLGGGGAFA